MNAGQLVDRVYSHKAVYELKTSPAQIAALIGNVKPQPASVTPVAKSKREQPKQASTDQPRLSRRERLIAFFMLVYHLAKRIMNRVRACAVIDLPDHDWPALPYEPRPVLQPAPVIVRDL